MELLALEEAQDMFAAGRAVFDPVFSACGGSSPKDMAGHVTTAIKLLEVWYCQAKHSGSQEGLHGDICRLLRLSPCAFLCAPNQAHSIWLVARHYLVISAPLWHSRLPANAPGHPISVPFIVERAQASPDSWQDPLPSDMLEEYGLVGYLEALRVSGPCLSCGSALP